MECNVIKANLFRNEKSTKNGKSTQYVAKLFKTNTYTKHKDVIVVISIS